jgi:hypothetical protein
MTTSDLCWYDGTFWDVVRPFYGQCGPQGTMGEDGRVINTGGQSRHSGFYKSGPGEKPWLGALGTNSCREDSIGPVLMSWEGDSLQEYTWYDDPDFAKRQAMGLVREPDAWLFGSHAEDVLAWMWAPVPINGIGFLSGGIAYGGGIYDKKTKTFRNWTTQARGPLNYKWPAGLITPDGGHSENLALNELFICYEHHMQGPDGGTALPGGISSDKPYKIKGYSLFSETDRVLGKEIDAEGRLYLLSAGMWNGGDLVLTIYDKV